MTPELVGRAVTGLCILGVLCVAGIIGLSIGGQQTQASLTSLSTLGGGAAGALAALLTGSTAPGAIIGGRRATDPRAAAGDTTTVVTTTGPSAD